MKILPQKSMKGTVVAIDHAKKTAVIQTVFGQFSTLDIKNSGRLEKGDIVRGYLESTGNETIVNESKDTTIKVFIRETGLTREKVSYLL
jgi:hypothetical protein